MPRQANGQYLQPANTAAVSGQVISSTADNTLITDIGTEITNSLDRQGRSAMSAPLPMGGQKITGMADPTVATDGATKNYVDTTTSAFFSTGDVKLTLKTVADTGWLLFNDSTFGSAASGAANPSNSNQALFTLLYNNISDVNAPLQTAGGVATTRAAQGNASAAWAANCRMLLLATAGRALGVAGSGFSLTPRVLGQFFPSAGGGETATLITQNLPPYTPAGSITNGAITVSGNAAATNANFYQAGGSPASNASAASLSASQAASTFTGTAQGGTSTPFSIMQPTVFLNAMIKL